MATDLENKAPIKPEDHKTMLQKLQGNILKEHGRDHSVHIFLKFKDPPREVRAPLARVAAQNVTSAWDQQEQRRRHKEEHVSDATFGNLFLTAKGYQRLGFSLEELQAAFPGAENYFLAGMKSKESLAALNDPDPQTWEKEYQKEIHAMILLANRRADLLKQQEDELMTELNEFADILVVERGEVQRNNAGRSVEHFGFVDGISQPIFFSTDLLTNINNWNPSASLSLVLIPDTLTQEKDCYGSYLVYRKLDQDVRRFILGTPQLATELENKSGTSVTPERVGAMTIGRFAHGGTPLTLSDQDDRPLENNFTYAHDSGLNCPVFAHIRATNPRTDKSKRIARRSIPYGRRDSMDRLPNGPAGLLFLCFQRNIDDQFAHIQQEANLAYYPLIRQPPDALPAGKAWAINGGRGTISHGFNPTWVTLKGGEFFFAPSIPFLNGLQES